MSATPAPTTEERIENVIRDLDRDHWGRTWSIEEAAAEIAAELQVNSLARELEGAVRDLNTLAATASPSMQSRLAALAERLDAALAHHPEEGD